MKEFLAGYDPVADRTDDFRTRAEITKACLEMKNIYVFGAVFRFEAQRGSLSRTPGHASDVWSPKRGKGKPGDASRQA